MLSYILRRLLMAVVVVFLASFLIYILAANAGDPLEDLRLSTAPNREALIQAKINQLQLDVPPPARYFIWLGGVLGIFTGNLDLGLNLGGIPVVDVMNVGIASTLRLVTAATVLSVLVGISIGMASALRQYSGFDYTVTFIAFLFFSLPIFWVAQLLKMYVAIGFNDFLARPTFSIPILILVAVIMGFVWASIVGGDAKKYFTNFGFAALVSAGGLAFIAVSEWTGNSWLKTPWLGWFWTGVLGIAAAFAITYISAGLANRKALWASLAVALSGAAMWYPANYLFYYIPGWWSVAALGLILVAIAVAVSLILGGDDRNVSVRTSVIVAVISTLLLVLDRIMGSWPDYVVNKGGRPIPTIGSATPNLGGSVWMQAVDSFTHLLLPTIALMLLSLAGWSRYSRASLLEVMNQDYVRTARAKGLGERTVIMRHAFRNALIPITTLLAFEIGGIIGGAVITETVFGWNGVGRIFIDAVTSVDLNVVMAFFLLTGLVTLVFNLLADLTYTVLDPRIRVS